MYVARQDYTQYASADFKSAVKSWPPSRLDAELDKRRAELEDLTERTNKLRDATGAQRARVLEIAGELQAMDPDWDPGVEPHPGHPTSGRRWRDAENRQGVDKSIGEAFLRNLGGGDPTRLKAAIDSTSGGTMTGQFYQPDILDMPTRMLFIRSLIPTITVDSDKVDFLRQTTQTNNAAPVSVGGLKPTSVFSVERVETNVTTIAHVSEAIDRMLIADVASLVDFLDRQLRLGVLLAEENQIINGNGTPPNLRGILNTSGIQTQALGADTRPDALYKALMKVRSVGLREPDGIVMSASDWQNIRLLRDANGQYVVADLVDEDPTRIWGIPVVTSPVIATGTALVGAFGTDARIYIREETRVSFAETGLGDTAGQEMFSRNQVRWRAEERLTLGIFRPASFCSVTGL